MGFIPHDFYCMEMEETLLMLEGWSEGLDYEEGVYRRMTMIISDVVNRSMGGKGVIKHAAKMWPMKGDKAPGPSKTQLETLKRFKEWELKTGILRKHGKR